MSRTMLFRLALAGVMMVAGGVTSAQAGSPKPPPDLSGQWRLDPSRSDTPGRPSGGGGSRGPRMGGRGGGGFPGGGGGIPGGRGGGGRGGWGRRGGGGGEGGGEGGPGEAGGPGGGDAQRGGGQRMRLPDFMRIEQSEAFVTLEDSSGTALQEITTRGGSADTTSLPPDVPRLLGQWKKDQLEVKHEDARGGTITETYSIEDKGQSLVLKTKVEGRRTLEFKRVYQRVNAQ